MTRRDESYVGVFFVAVRTTKVFCRPGCPARIPRPENVEFFASASAALHAGYRPCLRCRPMDPGLPTPGWMKDLMAIVESKPEARITDQDLVLRGIDPARARRAFKSRYGMTFQAYSRSRRLGRALGHVRMGQDVFETGLDHGYESDSGFLIAAGSSPGCQGTGCVGACAVSNTGSASSAAVMSGRRVVI